MMVHAYRSPCFSHLRARLPMLSHQRRVVALSLALMPLAHPALAQFTCVDASGTPRGASAAYATDTACGVGAVANGTNPQDGAATAFGYGATASYNGATAIGANAVATYNNDVAVGSGAIANSSPAGGGAGAVAIGTAFAKGTAAVAIGGNAYANGDSAITLGNGSALGNGAVAIDAFATANAATALGHLAQAMNPYDVALGANAITAVPNTGTTTLFGITAAGAPTGVVSVGAASGSMIFQRQIQNVAPGVISASSTDAINGSQLYAVAGGVDNLGQSVASALGGSAIYNAANGQVTGMSFVIQGTPYTTVNDAFAAADTAITTNRTQLAELTTDITNGTIGLLQQTGEAPGNGTLTLGAQTGGAIVNITGTAGTRQLTGLAPGAVSAASTDAVTGAQLYAATQTASAGWNLVTSTTGNGQVSGTASQNVAAGGTVTLTTGNNVALTQNGSQITIATSTTPTFASVTASGLTLSPDSSVNMGGNVLHNVAPGVAATDAATVGQLTAAIGAGGANAVQYDTAAHNSVTLNPGGTPASLHNVAAGTLSATSTDAINGSQLYATNQAVSQAQSVANSAMTTATTANTTVNNMVAGHAGLVQTDGTTITVGKSDASTRVDISGPDGTRTLTGLAPGVAANDAATVGQVWTGQQQVLGQANAYTDQQFNVLDRRLNALGAAAMAATSLIPNARAEGRFQLAAAAGTYGGASALAVGANYWVSKQVLLNAHLSQGMGGGAKLGASIGASIGF
ncbi:hemagluttinin domain-containing protein [Burkholderia pseudomallei]|uniref:beta strand repeat-containing protein n=1 Tax=Burkholderia pseudomallei TaxID=28450 RepID=UPI000F2241AC|nr:YadA-like family protein [Burkholderia pseudomallei]CAJ2751574.1 hemagluttinin domain-containing protein [Burkholderia pseudomallei]VCJ93149.1 hemagluttinin domain-containing protein [Burkholderia pseudomallei]VCJ95042.1 hemagluttinin domain-containing protein [Burkholderia pseudomallei]VCJ95640.1 hemagluttinin domain-containing protein [Burkholderia pseudomallei]VCJ97607.1 hemagluttinin domain-containing protein [Burkholderia pseudomallei]